MTEDTNPARTRLSDDEIIGVCVLYDVTDYCEIHRSKYIG